MSEQTECFPLHEGLTMHPADIGPLCDQPVSPVGFACVQSYTSSGYSSSGKKIKQTEQGIATSLISHDDACDKAFEIARDRAAELLKLKYLVTSLIRGYGPDQFKFVVPKSGNFGDDSKEKWTGINKKKQWEYKVTAMIPHLETIEPLWIAVQLLRKQTERPYICIVDTGSSLRTMELLERMRDEDLEIHYVRSNNYRHPSQPVPVAMDLAHSLCSTEYLFHTHSDVFLKRNDLIEDLLRICNEKVPAIGYQMSPRDWITPEWEGMLGHTLSLLHLPTIEKTGASWSIEHCYRSEPGLIESYKQTGGWPDTETHFNRRLKQFGIKPFFIGDDVNFVRQTDRNLDHCRSYVGSQLYDEGYFKKAEGWMLDAMTEALQRLQIPI